MSKQNSIFTNTSLLVSGNIIQRLLSLVTIGMVTRYLGPEKYGVLSFIISFAMIVSVIWDFGQNTYITRELAASSKSSKSIISGSLWTKILSLIVTIPFIVIYLFFYQKDIGKSNGLLVYLAGTFVVCITGIFECQFSAFKRMEFISLNRIIRPLVLLVGAYITIKLQFDLSGIVWAYFFSFVATLLFSYQIARKKFIPMSISTSVDSITKCVKEGLPFLLIGISSMILFRLDHIMIASLSGDLELGLYSSAYTIVEIFIGLFPIVIMNATFPVITYLFKNDSERFITVFNSVLRIFLFLGISITVYLIMYRMEIIEILYGKEFLQGANVLYILTLAVTVFFISSLWSWTLTAANGQKIVMYASIFAACINIAANFILIPKLGKSGAAIATIISEVLQLIIIAVYLRKKIIIPIHARVPNILFAGTVCFGLIWFFKSLGTHLNLPFFVNLGLSGILSGGIYMGFSVFTKALDINDLKVLRKN